MPDQQSALEHEAIAVPGRGQAVEKPLDAVEIKQSGEGTAFRFGLGPQARLNRVRKALRPPPLHTSASRNGFTIFSTRQILAK